MPPRLITTLPCTGLPSRCFATVEEPITKEERHYLIVFPTEPDDGVDEHDDDAAQDLAQMPSWRSSTIRVQMTRSAASRHARDFGLSLVGAIAVMAKVHHLAWLGGLTAPPWQDLLIFTLIGFVALKIIDAGPRLIPRIRESLDVVRRIQHRRQGSTSPRHQCGRS